MPIRMTSCPKKDQWVAVETTVNPVTQTLETAVNMAWWSGVGSPEAEDAGSDRSPVKSRMTKEKATSARRAGEVLAMLSMKSRARVKIHKPSRSGWPGCQLAGVVDRDWL